MFTSFTLALQFDTILSQRAYAQKDTTELAVDHFVGSRGGGFNEIKPELFRALDVAAHFVLGMSLSTFRLTTTAKCM